MVEQQCTSMVLVLVIGQSVEKYLEKRPNLLRLLSLIKKTSLNVKYVSIYEQLIIDIEQIQTENDALAPQ